jgi:hypothetical protein
MQTSAVYSSTNVMAQRSTTTTRKSFFENTQSLEKNEASTSRSRQKKRSKLLDCESTEKEENDVSQGSARITRKRLFKNMVILNEDNGKSEASTSRSPQKKRIAGTDDIGQAFNKCCRLQKARNNQSTYTNSQGRRLHFTFYKVCILSIVVQTRICI